MFNKLLKELKENKYTTIVFFIFLGLFLLGWLLYGMIMPSNSAEKYGNRLDGIDKVALTKSDLDNIEKDLEENNIVNSASVRISGRIINIIVEVKEGTKAANATSLSKDAIKNLDKEELAFYDIQLFITNEKEDTKGYPLIGYKSASAKKFVF